MYTSLQSNIYPILYTCNKLIMPSDAFEVHVYHELEILWKMGHIYNSALLESMLLFQKYSQRIDKDIELQNFTIIFFQFFQCCLKKKIMS